LQDIVLRLLENRLASKAIHNHPPDTCPLGQMSPRTNAHFTCVIRNCARIKVMSSDIHLKMLYFLFIMSIIQKYTQIKIYKMIMMMM